MCARNVTPFLNETWNVEGWTDGWTVAEPYSVGGSAFVMLLKTEGYAGDERNVHIHAFEADGELGSKVHAYQWSQGWSIAQFFRAPEGPRVLLLKTQGYDGQGSNVHVREVNNDGGIGNDVFRDRWTQGWTSARLYAAGAHQYLLLLKSSGYAADDNNVHIHRINANGSVGERVFVKRWTQGWSHVRLYRSGDATFLLLLKTTGSASDGQNLHINAVRPDGNIGAAPTDSRSIHAGWTSATTVSARGRTYLVVMNSLNGAVQVFHLTPDGRLGAMINAYDRTAEYTDEYDTGSLAPRGPTRWTTGWSDIESIVLGERSYLFAIKANLTGNQEKRAKILRVDPMASVGPIIIASAGNTFTVQVALAGGDNGDYRLIINNNPIPMQRLPLDTDANGDDYYSIVHARTPALALGDNVPYRVVRGEDVVGEGIIRAPQAAGGPPFTIAFASCADLKAGRAQPAWTALADSNLKPQLLVLTGDNAYANTTMRSMIWAEHLQQRGVDSFARAVSRIPTIATWDDHDFGPNNSAGEDVERANRDESARAFRELFHGLPFAANPSIYYRFRWQDVELFMLDVRYFRNRYKSPTGYRSTRAMLGDAQWGWLEDAVTSSDARFKILVSGTTLDSGATETWAQNYTMEYLRLRHLALTTPGLVVVSGDIHKCVIANHSLNNDRLLWEITSSGVGKGSNEHGYAMLTVDATVPDPTIIARLFRKNGMLREQREIRLSTIS